MLRRWIRPFPALFRFVPSTHRCCTGFTAPKFEDLNVEDIVHPTSTPRLFVVLEDLEAVQKWIKDSPIDSATVELAWSRLKSLPEKQRIPKEFIDEMTSWTMEIVESLEERAFTVVWHSMAKMAVFRPELLQRMAEIALGDSTKFLSNFSPRHLSNILFSLAKFHRLSQPPKNIPQTGVFTLKRPLAQAIVQLIFGRLNEVNELDISSVLRALGILGIPVRHREYLQLASEAEKAVHIRRYVPQDFVDIAFGLSAGGRIDLLAECPILVREIVQPYRLPQYTPRQLTLLIYALTKTGHAQNKEALLTPLLERIVDKNMLSSIRPFDLRAVVSAMGQFRIRKREIWTSLAEYLMGMKDFAGFSLFDVTAVLHAFGSVRMTHASLLHKINRYLVTHINDENRLSRVGLCNCFFGLGSLKYGDETLLEKLCTAIQKELERAVFTPRQLSNIVFSLGQVHFRHDVINALVTQAIQQKTQFRDSELSNLLFGLMQGIDQICRVSPQPLFEEIFSNGRLSRQSNQELSMAICALGKLKPAIGDRMMAIEQEVMREHRITTASVQDLIRIVKAIQELKRPLPAGLKHCLFEQKRKKWTHELPNRSLVDYVSCSSLLEPKPPLTDDCFQCFKELISQERIFQLSQKEIVDLATSIRVFIHDHSEKMAAVVTELVERVMSQGALQRFPSSVIHFLIRSLAVTKQGSNRAVLYSLAVECSTKRRLTGYSSTQLTTIFYCLSALQTMYRSAYDAFIDEILRPERLEKYDSKAVERILLGLSLGKCGNRLVVDAILNAFLGQNLSLEPSTISLILYNLTLLDCKKTEYTKQLVQNIVSRPDLNDFSVMELGKVVYSMAWLNHYDEAALNLLRQEVMPLRLKTAENRDICNLIYGFATFQITDTSVVVPLIAEALRASRCNSYTSGQIVKLLQKFAEWQVVNPCQLAGLVEALHDGRTSQINSLQSLTVLKSLMRLDLMQPDIAGRFLSSLLNSSRRMDRMSKHDLLELNNFLSMVNIPGGYERIQIALADKRIRERASLL